MLPRFREFNAERLSIGVLGTGRLGSALARSLAEAGKHEIWVCNRSVEKAESVSRKTGASIAENASALACKSEVVILAVKPKDIEGALRSLRENFSEGLLISVAAGITTGYIESQLREGVRVIRAMPNLGFQCGEGATAYALGRNASERDEVVAREVFGKGGVCVRVKDERELDAVTGVSGSGIAFIARVIDDIARAGELEGLSRENSLALAAEAAVGAAKLIVEGMAPQEIIDAVTSPNGTTAEGWEEWTKHELSKHLGEVVRAAIGRARELGK